MPQELNWTSFLRKIYIEAPIDKVYHALASTNGIESWMVESASYSGADGQKRDGNALFQTGDTFNWKWYNYPNQHLGKILAANGKDLVEFSFDPAGFVNISLEPALEGTMLTLKQQEIPTDDASKMNFYHGCSLGWTFWMTNLKAWLEHGITLHEKRGYVYPHDEGGILVNN